MGLSEDQQRLKVSQVMRPHESVHCCDALMSFRGVVAAVTCDSAANGGWRVLEESRGADARQRQ